MKNHKEVKVKVLIHNLIQVKLSQSNTGEDF